MKTYNIVTLGASGAGKTVFLPSLFRSLSIQAEHGFFLEVEDAQKRNLLTNLYAKIITGDTWPETTRYSDVNEWTFTCRVQNPALNNYAACQFTYVDYAGGRFTNMDENDSEFQNKVEKADSILGLLDGQKILYCLNRQNTTQANQFLDVDLPSILKRIKPGKVPIHFVISKWDLIENNQYNLKQVRDYLFSISAFQEIVRNQKNVASLVRLIPISSVGSKFASLKSDGSMKKNHNELPHPFQVEVPLACVLIDAVKANQKEFEEAKKKLDGQTIGKGNSWVSILTLGFDVIWDSFLEKWFPDSDDISIKALKILLSKLDDICFKAYRQNQEQRLKNLGKQKADALKQVTDEISALNYAIDCFLLIDQKLKLKFPESDLVQNNNE